MLYNGTSLFVLHYLVECVVHRSTLLLHLSISDFKRFIHTQIILEIFAKVLTAVFGFGAKIQTQYDIVLNLN